MTGRDWDREPTYLFSFSEASAERKLLAEFIENPDGTPSLQWPVDCSMHRLKTWGNWETRETPLKLLSKNPHVQTCQFNRF